MSDLRPAWLTDDTEWQRQLRAMPRDDRNWIEQQWDVAGGPAPDIDKSWLWMETEPVGEDYERTAIVLLWWLLAIPWSLTAVGVACMFTIDPQAINMAVGCGIPAVIFSVILGLWTVNWRRQR